MKTIRWKQSQVLKLFGAVCLLFLIGILFFFHSSPSPSLSEFSNENDFLQKKAAGISQKVFSKKRKGTTVMGVGSKLGNYEPREDAKDTGLGAYGKPASLPSEREEEVSRSIRNYGMNMALSNEISLERSVPDTRHRECKFWNYPEDISVTASVVIVFFNEGFSTVMRNVYSIINRTPAQLLKEIVLVDDFTDEGDLKDKLDDYITRFNGKVRVVRNSERQGLMGARTTGARAARGDVVVFLDAHCEVNKNWLPPLLTPIHIDRKTMTVPFIDGIDHRTFEYRPTYAPETNHIGIFEWGLFYKEAELSPEVEVTRKHKSAPYRSPTNAGGLFAIERNYFFELGAYDPGLLGWGGENYELSFKIWQCGGSVLWVPCSRVGHVYRGGGGGGKGFGTLTKGIKGNVVHRNYKRVVEVWFDDKYKEFYYTREPLDRYIDPGDLSEQFALKRRLNCKSFQWFMDNIARDLLIKYPELPPNLHWGELKNKGTKTCLDTMQRTAPAKMGVSRCHGQGNHQLVRLNAEGQIGIGERCVDVDENAVRQIYCPLGKVDGPWEYDDITNTVKHKSGKCLAILNGSEQLGLSECDPNNEYHQWTWRSLAPKEEI